MKIKIFKLIYVLYKIKLLSLSGLHRLFSGIHRYGTNIMALLYFAAGTYTDKTVLTDGKKTISYKQLLFQSEKLSVLLKEKYRIRNGQKAGFLCKNHASLVKAIFAVSRLGADIYLLNTEMSRSQFDKLLNRHDFDFLVYDFELSHLVEQSNYSKDKILSCHDSLPSINSLLDSVVNITEKHKINRTSMSKIVLLSGGTTGNFKEAVHKPSVYNFLNPFLSLVLKAKLINYNNVYIATPLYHGYGMAILLLFMALGKKVFISNGFDADNACSLIRECNVEVITVVPLMIYKMLKNNAEDLKSLSCIISGGAELNPKLIGEVSNRLGDVLYNLYGTSEAGLNMIATPQDLKYSPQTIGRKINGVRLKILDNNKKEVEAFRIGQFCIKNNWSMRNSKNSWIETGDLGFCDDRGYYFLCGRNDEMIVSAGENVYPIEVEQILINHPQIEDAAVIGVSDEKFGQRLKAFVLPVKNAAITKEELTEWLRNRVARFQMPKEIVFVDNMPYTPLGKLDKKQLK